MEDFKQKSELDTAKYAIIHEPQVETFLCSLHPAGALFKHVPDLDKVKANFEGMKRILKENGVKVILVRDALKMNLEELRKLACESLTYSVKRGNAGVKEFSTEEYKQTVVSEMSPNQLVDTVLTRPTILLKKQQDSTGVAIERIEVKPLGNLLYTRDQVIVTGKGVVLGRFNVQVREPENRLMETVFRNIGVKIHTDLPKTATLEGGDFIFGRRDLAFLGVGIRTNMVAAEYLLEKDLFGSEEVALVIDENDRNQERMHLDTFFNILSDKVCLLTDFENIDDSLCRKVVLYSKAVEEKTIGEYGIKKEYPKFKTFLEDKNYKIVYITGEQQENFMANLITIGNDKIVGIQPELRQLLKDNQVDDLTIYDLEFDEVKKMYGGVHCATQIGR